LRRSFGLGLIVAFIAFAMFPGAFTALASTSPPGAPAGVTASLGTLSATVKWTPSGAPATSFTVTSSPGGITATVDGTGTSATVSGLAFAVSYTFSVTGTNASGNGPASAPSNAVTPDPPGGPYHQGAAWVVLNSDISAGSPIATNFGGDPVHMPGLSAVAVNVTVSQASAAAALQLVVNQQIVQTIWIAPGQVESTLAVVAVPAQLSQSAIQLTSGNAHVQLDFVGYFTGPKTLRDHSGLLQMIHTATLLNGSVAASSSTDIPVLGQGDVPAAHVAGVMLNVTAINPAGSGSFTVFAAGTPTTGSITLGFAAGQTTVNRAIVPLPVGGAITLVDRGAASGVRVDVLGWFSDATDTSAIGSLYSPLSGARLVDTAAHGGPLPAGGSLSFPVWGQGGAPPSTSTAPPTSALLQITVVSPSGAGSIAISGTSVVDFATGQTVAGVDLVPLANDGSASLTVMGAATNVTVDLVAYFSGDLIVPGSTKVLSANQLGGITNLGSDLSIAFAPGIQVSPPIGLNDVIAGTVSPTTPNGLLRRVLSISHLADGTTVLGTRVASIPEAITAFSIDWVMPPNTGSFGAISGSLQSTPAGRAALTGTSPFPAPLVTSIDPNYPVFAIAKPPVALVVDLSRLGLGGSELDINDLEIQALPHLKMTGNPFAGGTVHLSVGFSVGVRAAIELQLLAQVQLLDRQLFEHFFPIGPPIVLLVAAVIPIVFQPGVDAQVEVKVSLDGGLIIDLGLDRYGAVSGGYDGTNFFVDQPVYKDYLSPTDAMKIRPSVQAQAELDLHLIPSLSFYGGVGKVGAEIMPFGRFTVEPTAPIWWNVALGVCREFKFDLNLVLIQKTGIFLPICVDLLTFHAPGPKLNVTLSPTSATVARLGTAHFQAGVAGSTHGVTWSVKEGSAGGSLSNANQTDVDYKAPSKAGTYHLDAAAIDDPTSFTEAVITVPAVAPSPPSGVTASLASPTSANVAWNPPSDDGGASLTGYQVTVSPGGGVINTNASTTTATASGLTPNTSYTFTATATNSAGLTSAPSSASAPIKTPPAGPMSVTPTALDFGSVALGQVSQPKTVLVSAGGVALVVSTVVLSGPQAGNFALQSDVCSGQTVPAGGSCSFAVVFKPTTQGPISAAVKINDNDATSPQAVTLTGSSPIKTTPGVQPIADIQMIDAQRGFLVDTNGVLATVDGGATWVRQRTPTDVQFSAGLNGPPPGRLRFVDTTHGWALACRTTTTPCTPLVIGTSDGGQTWQDLGALPANLITGQVWFADLQHGWVMGAYMSTPPAGYPGTTGVNALYASSDGGFTWTRQTLPDPVAAGCPVLDESRGNSAVRFADSLHGWAVGDSYCYQATNPFSQISHSSLAWTTSDGGVNWTAHQLPAIITVVNPLGQRLVVFSASQVRIQARQSVGGVPSPVQVGSDDGGATFKVTVMPLNATDVAFTDPMHAAGVNNTNGAFYRTSDGGATWVQVTILPFVQDPAGKIWSNNYHLLESPDGTNFWMVGSVDYPGSSAGLVEKSGDAGATWIVQLLGDGT
jgi:hypothetical protein